MRVKPQSDGIDEDKPADRLRRGGGNFGGQQTAERMADHRGRREAKTVE
jgi:hypothetical protein